MNLDGPNVTRRNCHAPSPRSRSGKHLDHFSQRETSRGDQGDIQIVYGPAGRERERPGLVNAAVDFKNGIADASDLVAEEVENLRVKLG